MSSPTFSPPTTPKYTPAKAWTEERASLPPSTIGTMKSKVVNIEDLSPLHFRTSKRAAGFLVVYLLEFIRERQACSEYFFLLPSIKSLADFFEIEATEVQKAFHRLRLQGHDSFMPGYYGNISLWTTPISDPSRPGRNIAFINVPDVF